MTVTAPAEKSVRPAYRPLTTYMVYLTTQCALRCEYCFLFKSDDWMSHETAVKVGDYIFNRNISGIELHLAVAFFGGEPMMALERMQDLVDICRVQSRNTGKRVSFSATTSGTIATAEVERIVKEARMSLLVSIDGTRDANAPRVFASGRPSYDAVARNLPKLASWTHELIARLTFHPQALDLVGNARHVLELGAPAVVLAPVLEADWSGQEEAVKEQYQALADWYIEELRAGRRLPLIITEMLLQELHRNQDSSRRPTAPCGMGKTLIGIEPNGNVMPCHRFIHRPHDWLGMVDVPQLSEKRIPFQHLMTKDMLGCDGCVAAPMCGGGCPLVALERGLALNQPHPAYCMLTRAHARAVRRIYATLMAEGNPTLKQLLNNSASPLVAELALR